MSKHQLFIWGGIGLVAGLYLAGASSNTGIYNTPVGQVLSNLWTTGNNLATGSTGTAAAS